MPLKGIPFVSKCKIVKTVSINRTEENKIEVEMIHQTFESPYSDSYVN